MSLGCARCGSCCAPVTLWWDPRERYSPATVRRWVESPDPDTVGGWALWVRNGWSPDEWPRRLRAIEDWRFYQRYATAPDATSRNAAFITEHWTVEWTESDPRGRTYHVVTCDAFDPVARLCTAHTDRPPICSDFPWYRGDPAEVSIEHATANLGGVGADGVRAYGEDTVGGGRAHCSYFLDVPGWSTRPGLRPLLPIAQVSGPGTGGRPGAPPAAAAAGG